MPTRSCTVSAMIERIPSGDTFAPRTRSNHGHRSIPATDGLRPMPCRSSLISPEQADARGPSRDSFRILSHSIFARGLTWFRCPCSTPLSSWLPSYSMISITVRLYGSSNAKSPVLILTDSMHTSISLHPLKISCSITGTRIMQTSPIPLHGQSPNHR